MKAIAAFLAGGALIWLATAKQKPSLRFLNPEGRPKPRGYTHVVTSAPGRMVFVSGQTGNSADGTLPDDFSSQARNVFENMRQCLALGGAKFTDIAKINYYVTDMANAEELRRIRADYLNMEAPPAATMVQAGLAKGMLLEVEALAIVPE